VFRARVEAAFCLAGRGTFVAVEILDGEIRVGDEIKVPVVAGERREATVSAVEFIDHVSEQRANIGLGVVGVEPGEVLVGGEVREARSVGGQVR
jgi:translation elongation factor EF-Tu-like GTPase